MYISDIYALQYKYQVAVQILYVIDSFMSNHVDAVALSNYATSTVVLSTGSHIYYIILNTHT